MPGTEQVVCHSRSWIVPVVLFFHPGIRGAQCRERKEKPMLLLIILLVVLILGVAPSWPYSRDWGYYPSGGLGTILVILIVLMLLGMVHL
jgi:hypothetical protein